MMFKIIISFSIIIYLSPGWLFQGNKQAPFRHPIKLRYCIVHVHCVVVLCMVNGKCVPWFRLICSTLNWLSYDIVCTCTCNCIVPLLLRRDGWWMVKIISTSQAKWLQMIDVTACMHIGMDCILLYSCILVVLWTLHFVHMFIILYTYADVLICLTFLTCCCLY